MPRTASPSQVAAHFTQSYIDTVFERGKKYATKLGEDYLMLQQFADKVNELASKDDSSYQMRELNRYIKEFKNSLQQSKDSIDDVSKSVFRKMQQDTAHFADSITQTLKKITGKEEQALRGNGNEEETDFIQTWDDLKAENGGKVLKAAGETKSAAKWIETFQKEIPKGRNIPAESVAYIFAARQLADAKLGKRANIDKTQLSEQEIVAHAEKLYASPQFQKYIKENSPVNEKLFRDGHGGKLEQTFEKFLVDEKVTDAMEFDNGGRYKKQIDAWIKMETEWVEVDGDAVKAEFKEMNRNQKVEARPEYKGYGDYFTKNIAHEYASYVPEKDRIPTAEAHTSKLAHAAKMAAANDLSRRKPDNQFDRKELDKRAGQFLKDPAFKLMTMDPDVVDLLCKGNVDKFAEEVDNLNYACRGMFDLKDEFNPKGEYYESYARLKDASENDPELKKVMDSYDELVGSTLERGQSEKKVIKALNDLINYQNKNGGQLGSKALIVNDTLRLFNETVSGTFLESAVKTQVDHINKMRGLPEGHPSLLTVGKIQQEGKEIKAQRYDLEHPNMQELDPLNTSVDYGNKAPKIPGM